MSNFKKAFSIIVSSLTVLATFATSVNVQAATIPANSLIKHSGDPAVYFYDGTQKWLFNHEKDYKTWYTDFSGVKSYSVADVRAIPLGGVVAVRPGTKLVQFMGSDAVYAVDTSKVLHPVSDEAGAALYGSTWKTRVVELWGASRGAYSNTVGAALTSAAHPDGTLIKYAGSSDVYYLSGGLKRKFTSAAALAANNINAANAVTTAITYAAGTDVTGAESSIAGIAGSVTPTPPVGGGLTVALSAESPASSSIPQAATNAKFMALTFTAGNSAVTLDGFTLKRLGVGASSDFSTVYAYDGAYRLTSGRTINSTSNEVMFTGFNLSIPVGSSKTLWVTADIANSSGVSGHTNYFSLESASKVSVTSGVTVSGSFPVTGNVMSFASATIGTLTVTKNGSVSAPKVGQSVSKVSEFKLAATTEDIEVSRIALYSAGSISRSNLSNFKLRLQGSSADLSTVAAVSSKDLVSFELATPYLITQGNDRIFEVYADISGTARSGDTIKLYVDEASDVKTVGKTYGYGAKITKTGFDSEAADHHVLTLEGGKLTVTFDGPTNQNLTRNLNDQVVFKFTMTPAQTLEVRKMTFTLASPGEDDDDNDGTGLIDDVTGVNNPDVLNFQDIKVKDLDSGLIITSSNELSASGSDATQNTTFNDYFTLQSSVARHFGLLVDIKSNNPDGNDLQVTMKVDTNGSSSTLFQVKSVDTSDYITDIVPSIDLTGNTTTVKLSTLTLGLASLPQSDTYVKRSTNVPAVGYTFQAGTSSDITVTSIKLTGYVDNNAAGVFTANTDGNIDINNLVTSIRLYEGDDLTKPVTEAKSLSSDGTVTFSGLTWKVLAGTTPKLVVRMDVSDSVAANNRLKFAIAANGDVSAQDKDSNSLTAGTTLTGAPANTTTADTGTRITFTTAGTLSVRQDASTPLSGVVLAGTSSVPFTGVLWNATRENFQVKKFNVTQTTAGANTAISGIRVSYPGANGTATAGPFALDSNGTAAIDISGNPLVVTSQGAVLSIYADIAPFTQIDGSDSGKKPVINLQALNATPTGGIDWEATGVSSGTTIGNSDAVSTAAIASNTQVVYKSKPVVALTTWTPSTGQNSNMDVYKWSVAASGNSVALKQMAVQVVINDNVGTNNTLTVGSFKLLRDSADITDMVTIVNSSGATIESANTLGEGTSLAYIIFSNEESIPAGVTYNYVLQATPAGFSTPADDDSFSVSYLADVERTSGYNKLGDSVTGGVGTVVALGSAVGSLDNITTKASLIWSDNATTPHVYTVPDETGGSTALTSSADWTNGYLVKNLPLSAQTIVF